MKGIRPDLVINGTVRASALAAMAPASPATNGNTWMEARAHKAVKQRDGATAALNDAVFATQVQKMGGITAVVQVGWVL
jgi:hypothetical protein